MQTYVPSFTEVRPNAVLVAPNCPICKSGMRFVQAMPIAFTSGLDDVSYVCDECGLATKRTLKRI
jgi:transposase-like protein